jgi:hypothetical protein
MDISTGESSKRSREFEPRTGPIMGSFVVITGWLVFILLYALYWSKEFDLFQNVIVAIVSLGAAGLLVCGELLIWYHPNGEPRRKHEEQNTGNGSL